MNYPVWDVPLIGGGWVIGGIAIFHVMISHFAIGGGLYLPMAEARALKTGRRQWLEFLPRHSKFFLILTGVYGAVSGVGIWFAIGLAAPEATSTLIHYFVVAWATEWSVFLVELSSAAVYYYTWGRVSDKLHLRVGWVYAGTSYLTLVVINGILAFMLTPGSAWLSVAGTGRESSVFFQAFFNPTFWPSLALRTLVCVSLAGIWALVTGSRIDPRTHGDLKTDVIRWSTRWLLPGFFLMPFCFAWYLSAVPASRRVLLELGVSTIGVGAFTQVTRAVLVSAVASATILAIVYLMAYRNPRGFRLGHACVVVLLGLVATGATEQAREMLRKPYVVGEHMYSNAIRKTPVSVGEVKMSEVEKFNREGYLSDTIWVTKEERRNWAESDARRSSETLPVSRGDQIASRCGPDTLARGELMFRGQCMACHTLDGYRSMRAVLRERNDQATRNLLDVLHEYAGDSPYRDFMPPLVGTEAEIEALAVYLSQLVNPTGQEAAEKPPAPIAVR